MINNDTVFNRIAQALLVDYTSVYYVDAVTNEYQWYSNDPDFHSLQIEQGGEDFFTALKDDVKKVIYEDDRDIFLIGMQKEKLLADLKKGTMQSIDYRLMIDGKPVYHRLRLIRGIGSDDYFIFGVINVDKEVREKMEAEKREKEREIYNQIASSLAEHYDTLYYVDMDTDYYFEFSSTDVYKKLNIPVSGSDFFAESAKNLKRVIHPDDKDRVMHLYQKDTIIRNLSINNTYTLTYRLCVNGEIMNVRGSQIWASDKKHIIICLENINNEVMMQQELQDTKKKSITYSQIAESLALNYDVIYYVDFENGSYTEYTANSIYGNLEIQEEGDDFFRDARSNIKKIVHPEDMARVANVLVKDYIITALDAKKQFMMDYRLIVNGKTQYTRFTAMWSSDRTHFIIGVENVNDEVLEENKRIEALNMANELARRDELTGTKNKNAYCELEASVQKEIDAGISEKPFAIVVCDINGLKHINDTYGHKAGDAYIQAACKMICGVFSHSPIFRIGGDEFVAFLNSSDYYEREKLVDSLREKVRININAKEGPVVSVGMAVYEPDIDRRVSEIFDRADNMMYEEKKYLKALGATIRG